MFVLEVYLKWHITLCKYIYLQVDGLQVDICRTHLFHLFDKEVNVDPYAQMNSEMF